MIYEFYCIPTLFNILLNDLEIDVVDINIKSIASQTDRNPSTAGLGRRPCYACARQSIEFYDIVLLLHNIRITESGVQCYFYCKTRCKNNLPFCVWRTEIFSLFCSLLNLFALSSQLLCKQAIIGMANRAEPVGIM